MRRSTVAVFPEFSATKLGVEFPSLPSQGAQTYLAALRGRQERADRSALLQRLAYLRDVGDLIGVEPAIQVRCHGVAPGEDDCLAEKPGR